MPAVLRLLSLVAVLATVSWPMDAQNAALTRDDRELFKWFDSLGYTPDLADKPLVVIDTGLWTIEGGADRVPERRLGFLLSETAEEFTVHLTSATEARYRRRPATADLPAVGMTRANLRAIAELLVRPPGDPGPPSPMTVVIPRFWRTQATLFMIARACAAAGLDELAHSLVGAAMTAERNAGTPASLKQELSGTIANQRVAMIFADFERGGTRVVLRDEIRKLIANFPQADFAKTESSPGREMARELERMVAEDMAREKRPVSVLSLPGRARIAELIYLLRDQHAPQRTMPGYPDFVCGWVLSDEARRACESVDSPVRQLIYFGAAAVPQLIEALDDTRLTRAVHSYRPGMPVQVLRIGDCALQILEAISGQRFTSQAAALHTQSENERKLIKKNIAAWWNLYKGKSDV